jgi:hypothetical protein
MGLVVFIFVMLGTFGFILFMQTQSQKRTVLDISPQVAERVANEQWTSLIIFSAVIGVVILGTIVWFLIQRARSATHQISVAKGPVESVSNDQANYNIKIKIGETVLRLTTLEQLEAFASGVEYRVFYLAGARPIILSAEVVGRETADVKINEQDEEREHIKFMQLQKRGRVVAVIVGLFAVIIPFLGVAASHLPKDWRSFAWILLLVIAIGFVCFALQWISPHKPKTKS